MKKQVRKRDADEGPDLIKCGYGFGAVFIAPGTKTRACRKCKQITPNYYYCGSCLRNDSYLAELVDQAKLNEEVIY